MGIGSSGGKRVTSARSVSSVYLCWRVAPLARVKILQMFILMNHCRVSSRPRHRIINTLTALLFTSSVMSAAVLSLLLCLSKLQIISVFSPLPFVAHFQGYFFLFKSHKVGHRDHYCFVVKNCQHLFWSHEETPVVQFRRSADSSRYLAYLGIASIYYYYRNKDGRFCSTQQHYLLSNLSLSVKLNVIMRLTQSSVIARTDDPFLNLFVTSGI